MSSLPNLSLLKESPLSWKIWLGFWILPILVTVPITYLVDPIMAAFLAIFTGGIVYTMIVKPDWTRNWTIVVDSLDMLGYVFVIGIGEMESVDFGTALKEILFLLYILFSTNALAYQGRFKQKKEDDDSDADFQL